MPQNAEKRRDEAELVEYLGLIRYTGKPLELGYLDARQSATALIGFDSALRYFIAQQDHELAKSDYPIPMRIRTGCVEALIPHNIETWITAALGLAATRYLVTAANTMAKNDFKDVGLRDLFKRSIQAMQWVIRIGKHLHSVSLRTFNNLRWRNNNTEIGIPNDLGRYLYVPHWAMSLFEKMPAHLLRNIASLVTGQIHLEVIVRDGDEDVAETLRLPEKSIFCPIDGGIPFPELVDGMPVTLEGLVTRGNGNTNTIGFQYHEHILTCYPEEGDVVRYKPAMFVKSKIVGIVKREGKRVDGTEPKPKIVFRSLVPLKDGRSTEPSPGLFDDGTDDTD